MSEKRSVVGGVKFQERRHLARPLEAGLLAPEALRETGILKQFLKFVERLLLFHRTCPWACEA